MSSLSKETIFLKNIAILPETGPIIVLHVDDEPDFADLTSIYLERESDEIEVITADCVEAGLEHLETDAIDCIVSDYDMPHRNGLDLLAIVREEYPELPFILFTGKGSEEIASEAISAGVTDYLQKKPGTDQYTVLANRIQNAASQYKSKRETERMGIALQTVDAGIAFLNEDGQFIYVNPAYEEIFGYAPGELTGQPIDILYPDELAHQAYEDILPTVPQEGEWTGESIHTHKDGTRLIVNQKFSYCSARMLLCFILNVTEQN